MLAPAFSTHKNEVPIIQTIAHENKGPAELIKIIEEYLQHPDKNDKRHWLLTEKVWKIIESNRMKDLSKTEIADKIKSVDHSSFNLYKFAKSFH